MAKSGFAKDHLNSFIQRIERLEEEKAALAADIREVYAEAKGTGFDPKIMRKVIALRKMDAADRQEMEAILDLYKSALGMLSDTPLGEAAVRAVSAPKKKQPPHDPETGEIIESLETATKSGVGPDLGETAAQSPHEAVTSRERPALNNPRESGAAHAEEAAPAIRAVNAAPVGETEIPSFLDRRPKRQVEHV